MVVKEDIFKTKEGGGAVNSIFFSGKRRSIAAFLIMMVYILTPAEGRALRNETYNVWGKEVNRNQTANPEENKGNEQVVNNNEKEDTKQNDRWHVAMVIVVAIIPLVFGAIGALFAGERVEFPPQPQV
jgi:hypothetical protein